MKLTGLGGGNGGQREDYGNYSTKGFVTLEKNEVAAPLTLSYAFDDASIARLSQCLIDRGGIDNATRQSLANTTTLFSARSRNYETQWEKDRRLMCPRFSNGTFACPAELEVAVPYPLQKKYLEGDAAQWQWFVPHDPEGLAALFPSNTTYLHDLEEFFNKVCSHPSLARMPMV